MADTDAEWSIGDSIEYGDGAEPTESFNEIDGIKDISFNLGTRTLADTTTHQSTPPFRDNVATFLEGGTIQLAGNFLPMNASQQEIESKRADDLATSFRYNIFMADGHIRRCTGQARVTAFNPTSNAEDARRLSITLAPTGAWVWTQES